MQDTLLIDGDASLTIMIDGDASITVECDGEGLAFLPVKSDKYYIGETDIIPSDVVQVLSTKDLVMAENITIEPIPSNYGKIIYNGAYLRVE